MSSSTDVPDAWDDDWVNKQLNSQETSVDQQPRTKRLNKAERRRQQLEFNKKLWEEAESPDTPYLVQHKNDVPLQSGFAPQVKVLSRKPPPTVFPRKDRPGEIGGVGTSIGDEEDEDEPKPQQMSAEERAEKAQKELEEKKKKYDEARQKIFGVSSASGTTDTQTAASTPPRRLTHNSIPGGENKRYRGRGSAARRGSPTSQLYNPVQSRDSNASNTRR